MFGQTNRPAFGATTGTTFGFGASNTTGFGQSAFGAKPAGTATTGFQTPAFGTNTSIFGATGTTTSQPTTGLFGAPTSTFGTPAQPAPAFGAATGTTGFGGFGAATSGGSIFGAPTQSTGMFGAAAQPAAAPAATGGLFGASTNTAFGAQKPAFGFGSTTSTGLFGQPQAQPAQSGTLFAQPAAQPAQTSGLFGASASAFGPAPTTFGAAAGTTGTTVKFVPFQGTDSMVKNNVSTNINTHHQCISCMKEYENKSLEELRYEDYLAGRKAPGAGAQQPAGGMFGAAPTAATGSFFGQQAQQQKPLFGAATTGIGTTGSLFGQQPQQQVAGTSMFGKPLGFGQPATSTPSAFGFSQPQAQPATNFFGQPQAQQQKPFGAAAPIFGAATAAPQTSTATFGFGQPQQSAAGGIFGAAKPAFGTTTTSASFGFPQTTATSTAGGGLFGAKPGTIGFGTTPAPAFGAATATSSAPSFGFGTGTGLFTGATAAAPAFGAKPATTGLTFGAPASAAGTAFSGFGQTGSMFSAAPSSTLAKPGGIFGAQTGFGLGSSFGTGTTFGATPALGTGGLGTASTGLSFGGTGTAAGALSFGAGQPAAPAVAGGAAQLPIHDYILTLSELSQTSDHPLFRKMLEPTGKREELIKTTTSRPVSTAAPTPPQYRISPLPCNRIRAKAILNGVSSSGGRRSIFEGLSDEETDADTSASTSASKSALFVPRRSVKKLQLKTISLDTTVDGEETRPGADAAAPAAAAAAAEEEPAASPSLDEEATPADTGRSELLRQRADLDDSVTVLNIRRAPPPPAPMLNSSILDETGIGAGDLTVCEEIPEVPAAVEPGPPHPAGLVLRRAGYFTVPSMEDLAAQGLDEEGRCLVDTFTVGRHNYGQVFFQGPLDVANLNLDDIVIFRHKEVTVYPDDKLKPAEGQGLNRKAEITLDRVWPVDKCSGEYITDPQRLLLMRYEDRLARAAHRLQAKFVEYRPETGSWIFRVHHFSKYGLDDSDEEELPQAGQAKAAVLPQSQAAQPMSAVPATTGLGGATSLAPLTTMEEDMAIEEDEPMLQPSQTQLTLQPQQAQASQLELELDREDHDEAVRGVLSPPPVTTQLARTLGMPSQRVQIMKASFFDADMDYGADASAAVVGGGFIGRSPQTPNASLFTRKLDMSLTLRAGPTSSLLKAPFDQTSALMELDQTQPLPASVALQPRPVDVDPLAHYVRLEREPKPAAQMAKVVPRFASAELPLKRSLLNGKMHVCADAALFHSRSFRVGWAPDLRSARLDASRASRVSLESVLASHFAGANPCVTLLSTCLQHAQRCSEAGVPTLKPTPGSRALVAMRSATEDLVARLKQSDVPHATLDHLAYMLKVWKLCMALWGPIEDEVGGHAMTIARKEALSRWLEEAATETEIAGLEDEEEVLTLLARHDVAGAARMAQKSGEPFLTLLISQAGSSATFKNMLQRQLQLWTDNRVDRFVKKDRIRLLALLAGIPVWETAQGAINTCQGMDWIKALAHHLWYVVSPVGSIADALLEYETACGIAANPDVDPYAAPPAPAYAAGSPTEFRDLCFQLISLYCHRTTPLESVLNPLSHTANVSESTLSWLLWQQLTALGYSHLSETAGAQLTTAFAAQLENSGLWQWSVFVLLHLSAPPAVVQSLVQDVIDRHLQLEGGGAAELFLTQQLAVPAQWIERGRAVRAMYAFAPRLQADSLLAAGLYDQAHDVICDQLAPEAVLCESHDQLEALLAPLADAERCALIADWPLKGKIYWNYITVVNAVDRILSQENGREKGIQLEKLTPDLLSLCNLVSALPVPTAKHRLVRTEIAQKAAYILKTVIGLQSVDASGEIVIPPRFVLPQLRQLPVTQDYSLQELNNVVRAYFLELNV